MRSDKPSTGRWTGDTHRSVCENAAFTLSTIDESDGAGALSGNLLEDEDGPPVLKEEP